MISKKFTSKETTVSHEAPENPTALLGSAGFLRLLRSPAAHCGRDHAVPTALRLENGLLRGENSFRQNTKLAAISTMPFGWAGKHEGRGSGLLSYRSAPARCGRRRSLALLPQWCCQKGTIPFGQLVFSIARSIPRNYGHQVLVVLTGIATEIGI
jgi:hypothetical protein